MNLLVKLFILSICLSGTIHASETMVITGARVHTLGPEGTHENAIIIINDSRFTAIGSDLEIPDNAVQIDATGKIITPGLFSPMSQLGLVEVAAVAGTNDATQRGDQFSAGFDVADAYNPRSTAIPITRVDGITRATIIPRGSSPDEDGNASGVLSGLGSVVNLGEGSDHFLKRGAVVVVNFGESGSQIAAGSRALATMILRNALDDAIDYRENKTAYERGDLIREYSVSTFDLKALQSVIDGRIPLLFHVNRASDISVIVNLVDEYKIQAIIAGGAEAWMVAEDLASKKIPVILDGMNNLPVNFDHINARLDSASILNDAGVQISFGASLETPNARNLRQSAGISVANGLPWDKALEAISLSPAKIFGVDMSIGSIEVGKEADFVIWASDPLELMSYPEQVFIQGIAIPMKSRQTLLRDRYLQSGSDKPPAFRNR